MKRIGEYRPYEEQLQHPEWKETRIRIFNRDGNKCTECGNTKHLQCHHKLYVQGFNAWEYTDSCYTTLCRYCHIEIHEETVIPVLKYGYKIIRKYLREDIRKKLDKELADKKAKSDKISNYKYYYQKDIKHLIEERAYLIQSDKEHPDLMANITKIDNVIKEYLKFLKYNGK